MEAVVAIAGLADVAVRTSSKLWELSCAWREAPEEIHRLRDDLSRTHQFFDEIREGTTAMYPPGSGIREKGDYPQTDMDRLLGQGAAILARIEAIVDRLVMSGGEGSDKPRDLGKRRRLVWMAAASKDVAVLRRELGEIRSSICRVLIAQNMHLTSEIYASVEESHDRMKSYVGENTTRITESIVASSDATVSHIDYRFQLLESSIATALKQSGMDQVMSQKQQLLSKHQDPGVAWLSVARHIVPPPRRASQCDMTCHCQCHSTSSYSWRLTSMQSVIGLISVAFSGQPPRKCTSRRCRDAERNQTFRDVRVVYNFPNWLSRVSLSVFCSSNLNGSPHMNIRVLNRRPPSDANDLSGLIAAVRLGDTEGVRRVLKDGRGSVFDVYGDAMLSPLWFAMGMSPRAAIVKLLLQAGADPFQEVQRYGGANPTRLAFGHFLANAAEYGEIAQLFPIDTYLENTGYSMLQLAVIGVLHVDLGEVLQKQDYVSVVNRKSADGTHPLQLAATRGDYDAVKLLLRAGADVDLRGSSGVTALHGACRNGHHEVTELLLKAGAHVGALDDDGQNVLFRIGPGTGDAASKLRMLSLLVSHGADVNQADYTHHTPLVYSVVAGCLDTFRGLVNYSANINYRDPDGDTIITDVILYRRYEIVEFILDHGFNVLVVDGLGRTVLHILAAYGDLKMVEIFSRKQLQGLSTWAKDNTGKTALQLLNETNPSPELRKAFDSLMDGIEAAGSSRDKISESKHHDGDISDEEFVDAQEMWECEA